MTIESRPPLLDEILRELREQDGSSSDLWRGMLKAAARLNGARAGIVFQRDSATGALEPIAWTPNGTAPAPEPMEAFREFALLAERNGSASGEDFVATRVDAATEQAMAVLRIAANSAPAPALATLELAAAAAAKVQLNAALKAATSETEKFAGVLDLAILLDEADRFIAAAMQLCNQVAARHHAERVSLGWLRGRYIRVEAISHSDRFERKSEAVTALAAAMEEALDADDEIVFPATGDATVPARFHAEFARSQSNVHLASIPLRVGGEPQAVITLERASRPFELAELRSLRLMADHAARRLDFLRRHDRWIGARFAAWLREKAATLLGPEHTGPKLLAIAVIILLAVLVFGQKTYRVEAPFTLQSDTTALLPAPFDGYIDQVHFRIGDTAASGQPLVKLVTRELALQESAAVAEQSGWLAEAEKAQSAENIVEMQIALAKSEQARARLDRSRYLLAQAEIKAPFDGVVFEGDLRERIGAPVKQGEALLKLGRISDLYAEADVSERSIHELRAGAEGEIAFASRPELKFPIRLDRIEPVATASEKGNNFIVRCAFPATPESWWRPGMTGTCKVDVGRRSLMWILTHRTVEFLRMHFWW